MNALTRRYTALAATLAANIFVALVASATPAAESEGGAPAVTSVPATVAFQGYLADPQGVPVDGTVSLILAIYGAPAGGAALWTETQASVVAADGIFQAALGAVAPLSGSLFGEAPRFLGIRVNGEPELPRTELRSSPFTFRAQTATTADNAISITNDAGHLLYLSTPTPEGLMTRYFNARLGVIQTGTSYFSLSDESGFFRIILEGGATNGAARLSLLGGSAVSMDMGLSGDQAVSLPGNSIRGTELLDEPGLASANNTNSVVLTGSAESAISRTITPPANGYVLALRQSSTRITHTNGTATSCLVGLSDDGTTFGSAQDVNAQISSQAASGSYAVPVHVNGVFLVTAGLAKTIHILASESSGDVSLEDLSLSLLFVPTSYGTVSSTLTEPGGEESPASRGAQTPEEVAAERAGSERWNADRIEGELREMQTRLAELQQELSSER